MQCVTKGHLHYFPLFESKVYEFVNNFGSILLKLMVPNTSFADASTASGDVTTTLYLPLLLATRKHDLCSPVVFLRFANAAGYRILSLFANFMCIA